MVKKTNLQRQSESDLDEQLEVGYHLPLVVFFLLHCLELKDFFLLFQILNVLKYLYTDRFLSHIQSRWSKGKEIVGPSYFSSYCFSFGSTLLQYSKFYKFLWVLIPMTCYQMFCHLALVFHHFMMRFVIGPARGHWLYFIGGC